MPMWLKDYFELKAMEKKQVQESFLSPTLCQRARHEFVKMLPSLLYQEEQKLIIGDNSRPSSVQKAPEEST